MPACQVDKKVLLTYSHFFTRLKEISPVINLKKIMVNFFCHQFVF